MSALDSNVKASPNQLAVAAWQKILEGVRDLEAVYDAYPDLNDTQPAIAEKCIPMSVDDWAAEIEELIEQLRLKN